MLIPFSGVILHQKQKYQRNEKGPVFNNNSIYSNRLCSN